MNPPFKGEAQGTFRRVPHPPPLKPLSATPPSGSLCGGRIKKLALSASFFSRENALVLVGVFSQRFLIIDYLKIANSLTLKHAIFVTVIPIRNLCTINEKFFPDVLGNA